MVDLRIVDLFCGCGGMSLGFEGAGFKVTAAFDNWKPALQVYEDNFDHIVGQLDLGDPESDKEISRHSPDIIIGGPPCQDFSSAGHKNYSNERANLAIRFAEIVSNIKPKYFVMENVPRIRHSQIFLEVKDTLKRSGYGLTEKILDASLCGVPQARKRVFLIGHLGGQDDFLSFILDKNLAKERLTMRAHFGDELEFDYYFRIPTNYNRRGIFSVDEPCVTIRAIDRPIPGGYRGHPSDPVPLTDSIRGLTVLERSYVLHRKQQ